MLQIRQCWSEKYTRSPLLCNQTSQIWSTERTAKNSNTVEPGYSRIRIYATRLYSTFVYMQLFPGSQKVLKHCFSYGYMQLSRICNFFLVPEQLHITGFYCIV